MEEKPIQLYCPKCKIVRGQLNEAGELLQKGVGREQRIKYLSSIRRSDGGPFFLCTKCKTKMELE